MDKQQFFDHIRVLNEKIALPEEAAKVVLDVAELVFSSSEITEKCEQFNQQLFMDARGVTHGLNGYAEELGVPGCEFLLFMCEYNSYTTKKLYDERCIDMGIYYESMLDITVWAKTCLSRTGCWGIDNYDWVTECIKLKLFRLGRLQFQFKTYEGPDYEHAGVRVKNGDRVINMHIPEGGSFSRDKRLESYRRAYHFFNQTGNAVFVCRTWLLYEKHFEFLPPESNIIDFMKEFELVECVEWDRSVDLWRIFGCMDSYDDIEALPKETGLQRAYARWWGKYHKTGYSYGVFIFDGQNIL